MQVSQFILVRSMQLRKKRPLQEIVMPGQNIIPIGKPVPVIVKGEGCVGLGVVTELRIRDDETEVWFELDRTLSKSEAAAYYNLYRNGQSKGTHNPYDNTDAVIPGAIGSLRGNNDSSGSSWSPDSGSRRNRGGDSLSDYLDESDYM